MDVDGPSPTAQDAQNTVEVPKVELLVMIPVVMQRQGSNIQAVSNIR